MPRGRVEQLGSAVQRQLDPVLDLEAGRLACVLDGVDDLAGAALGAQVLVHLEVEGDGVRALALDAVALRARAS